MSSLDQYMVSREPLQVHPREDLKSQLVFGPSIPRNLTGSYFIGAGYDGERRLVFLKLYEPETQRVHFWFDNTGHLPYCYSKKPIAELERDDRVTRHPGFLRFKQVAKYDALEGREIQVTKIIVKDPLSIGGRATGSFETSSQPGKQTFAILRTTSMIANSSPEWSTRSKKADYSSGARKTLPKPLLTSAKGTKNTRNWFHDGSACLRPLYPPSED